MFPLAPKLDDLIVNEISDIIFGTDELQQPTAPCDVIFIFGGVDPGLWSTALNAYHSGLASYVVATGGRGARTPDGVIESKLIRERLIEGGVPKEKITIESSSTNSYENVTFAMEVFDFSKVQKILMVCTSRGIGRQSRTLKQHLKNVTVVPHSFDSSIPGLEAPLTRENWRLSEHSRNYIWGQVLRIHVYGLLGHLQALEGISSELSALIQSSEKEF